MKPMNIRTTVLIITACLASQTASAFRPAMEDNPAPASTSADAEPVDFRPAPVPAAAPAPMSEPAAANTSVMTQQHSGDVLEIQPGETIDVNPLAFPRRGMTMDKVKNELGEPLQISPTVGQPPITTWHYADRKIYFEGTSVIHVVAGN